MPTSISVRILTRIISARQTPSSSDTGRRGSTLLSTDLWISDSARLWDKQYIYDQLVEAGSKAGKDYGALLIQRRRLSLILLRSILLSRSLSSETCKSRSSATPRTTSIPARCRTPISCPGASRSRRTARRHSCRAISRRPMGMRAVSQLRSGRAASSSSGTTVCPVRTVRSSSRLLIRSLPFRRAHTPTCSATRLMSSIVVVSAGTRQTRSARMAVRPWSSPWMRALWLSLGSRRLSSIAGEPRRDLMSRHIKEERPLLSGDGRSSWGQYYWFNGKPDASENTWVQDQGRWYYLTDTGVMATGWAKDGVTWYFFEASGAMRSGGWMKQGGTWYYLGADGAMRTGWQDIGGARYYLQPSGAMATGWVKVDGAWYFLHPNGAIATGWQSVAGTWYYLGTDGVMVDKDTVVIDGRESRFASSGAWLWYA
ncbi:hypothetical protein CYJ26_03540 [Actinomyces urogenitalis]|uniref:N-acetylmuramoyl-L-alanine amidase family protein n=3 Tax=Actinomyces urogenitalis TaxID=103621 RepID=A0A2I1KUB0_9ACTO|nr:hypothetical protein CYJ26_03540 [Actinomyces urogenitalis]